MTTHKVEESEPNLHFTMFMDWVLANLPVLLMSGVSIIVILFLISALGHCGRTAY